MVYFKTNFVFGLLARLLLTETARVLFLVIFLKRKRLLLVHVQFLNKTYWLLFLWPTHVNYSLNSQDFPPFKNTL